MKPVISVIMLTYNRENLIEKMINCVLTQDFCNFEFIIVDNGSTDNSGIIAQKYAIKDSRVKVLHKEKGNIGSGRNAGLKMASGDFIAFVDDDDECTFDYLSFLYSLAVDNEADISICGINGKEMSKKFVFTAEEAIATMLWRKKFNVGFPTKLIKKALFEKNLFNNESKYDDIYLMPKIIASANKIVYKGQPKYIVNRHENNNSAWTTNHNLITSQILREYMEVYTKRTNWLCKKFPNNSKLWKYFEWSFYISMTEKIIRLELSDCYNICNCLVSALKEVQDEFINSEYILDFEKQWMKKYIATNEEILLNME